MLTRYLRFIAIAAFAIALPAAAHHDAENAATPRTPRPGAQTITVQGYSDDIVVEDAATGHSQHFPVLAADDGRRYLLVGPNVDRLAAGATIKVAARQEGGALFADSVETLSASDSRHAVAKAAPLSSFTGILRLGHADNFDGTPSEFFFALETSDGRLTRIDLATMLPVLKNGMRVTIDGRLAATGELVADRIAIEALPKVAPVTSAALTTTGYLVLPIKFPTNAAAPWTYGADPFTPTALNTAVFGASPSVLAYYNEVSYGQHLISGITADNGAGGFLLATVAKPATCDINAIATAAKNAATARGYNLAAYPGVLYVFNNVAGCGWSGLAYVGTPIAYSNNTTNLLVIAHEMGHNFGLAHAASLDCGTNSIGGTCTSAEYGDPFDVMGNNRAMHFNTAQKAELNWIAASTVATHTTGQSTYTLTPIESAGGARYAVKVPAAPYRTYWIEFRQPIGFDSALSGFPNNGAQIRAASPFESLCSGCYDDTEFLDMTPATAALTDGALVAGQAYADGIYGININVLSATASLLTVQVTAPGAASSTITQTSSQNPAPYGSNITFTATVTGAALTGFVNFTESGGAIAGCSPAALSGAGPYVASCTTGSVTPGTHSIVAVYAGDAAHAAASSTAISQVVNKAGSSVTLASSLNPSSAGSSVTFTATVTGSTAAAPTGAVDFRDGGTLIAGCSVVALTGAGNIRTAACTTSALTAGTHSITAVFAGDVVYLTSTSAAVSQTVNSGGATATTTTLASSANPSVAGASVTFTASVTGLAPTGTVNFTNGGVSIAGCSAVALTGSGNTRTAACSTSALAAGTRSIVATYSGDATNAVSTSATLSQVVKTATTTTVASSANPSLSGASVTFTASVTGLAPTGSVNFTDGGISITGCSAVALTGSGNTRTAACSTASLTVATHSIVAAYGGDSGNVASGSATLSQVVNSSAPTATTTTLASSANPSVAGASVTFTASVTGVAPTGNVNFTNGGVSIAGCSAVALAGSGNTRTAVCSTSALAAGTRSIVAAYGGNASNLASSSSVLSQVVKSATTTTLASSANPSLSGASVTFTASVTGVAPTGSVNFTDGGTSITGCSAVALTGSGNTRTAACSTASLSVATHSIVAAYGGDAANLASTSATLSQVVNSSGGASTNVALAANGGVASASSVNGAGYPAAAVNNGDRAGLNYAAGGVWMDNSSFVFPDWVQINFSGAKTINQVIVYTMQDSFTPVDPSNTLTFTHYGVTDFQVQGWNGSAWVTLGTVAGNNLVKRTVNFTATTTDRIRVNVTGAIGGFSRVTEIEAWTSGGGGPTPTTTTVASSANPSLSGASVTFTASVTGLAPTGSVNFTDGGTSIAGCSAVALTGSGNTRTAACSTASLTVATHSIVASYGGDAANVASASATLSQVVNSGGPAATTTTLASSANPSLSGASVTFTASVTGVAPTGSVNFTDGGTSITGCSAVALTGSGNTRTAACSTASLTVAAHSIVAAYGGDAANLASASAVLSQVVNAGGAQVNVALASNGGVASASSVYGAGYPAAAVNNGDRAGLNYAAGGVWMDSSSFVYPDWVQVDFSGTKTIDHVIVYTMQDAFTPVDPSNTLTFTRYGVTDFQVQGWNGSTWVTLGSVAGNNLVKRTVNFTATTTDRIRVNVTGAIGGFSRIAEVEVWGN